MIRRPERLRWIREMNKLPYRPPNISVGKNTRIHDTALIGVEGYGLERDERGKWIRCRQHGGVRIGNDVDIGAYSVVARATLPGKYTIIGNGTKLATFVNIGHNCVVGEDCFIGHFTMLCGSVTVGNRVWIAPHAVVKQQLKIGDDAVLGLGAVVVTEDVPPKMVVAGVPARRLK